MNADQEHDTVSLKFGANWVMGSAFTMMESSTALDVTQYLTGVVCTVCHERFSRHVQVIFLLIF